MQVRVPQSDDFARIPTRVMTPLVRADAMPRLGSEHARAAPVPVEGYVLNPFDLATLGVHQLGKWVASFAENDEVKRRIRDALDVVLKPF